MSGAAVGIDFGTTNTVLAHLDGNGHARLVHYPVERSEPLVPFRSALSFHAPPEDPSARVVEAGPWAIEAYTSPPNRTWTCGPNGRQWMWPDLLEPGLKRLMRAAGVTLLPY